MRRNVDSPYHIDYVFTQNNIIQKVEINVGSKDKWLELSDHLPLTIKF